MLAPYRRQAICASKKHYSLKLCLAILAFVKVRLLPVNHTF